MENKKKKKRHVGNDNSIAFNDTCDHALRLPFSATHAINLTKDITHTSDTHTLTYWGHNLISGVYLYLPRLLLYTTVH